jgi:hypothetical protein
VEDASSTWLDGPCEQVEGFVLTGICEEYIGEDVYRAFWTYAEDGIPAWAQQTHNSQQDSCLDLDREWCSIEDGSGVEPDCTRTPQAGICDLRELLDTCNEYDSASLAETACGSNGIFTPDSNCPTENVIGWCHQAFQNFYYYDGYALDAEALEANCVSSGNWCTAE